MLTEGLRFLLIQRHTAAFFEAVFAFLQCKHDDLALSDASDVDMVEEHCRPPRKACRDALGEAKFTWLACRVPRYSQPAGQGNSL